MSATATPLLLLPGLLLDRRLFAAQSAALADLAACHHPDLTGADSIAGLASQVLARAPAQFALAGLSMGGYVALEILRQAPGRVTRLALLNTQARADDEAARSRREALMTLAGQGAFAAAVAHLVPLFLPPARHGDAALTAAVTAMADSIGAVAFLRQQTALLHRIDSRPHLAAIACPTLVLVGRDDALTPVARHEEMAQAIPNAALAVLPRCGHLSPLERPEAVSALLRLWLQAPPDRPL